MTEVAGLQTPVSTASHYNALVFVIAQQLRKLNTVTLVKVVSVTNAGGVEPVGFVDVQPLVNQVTGTGTAVPHGVLHRLPYLRVQGGTDAVILDPKVGDIGIAAFASRDISAVKNTKAQASPGSHRLFDFADGLYFGGVLNGTPQQYVAFAAGGITVVSPTKITLQAPEVDITTTGNVNINGAIVSPAGEVTDALGKVLGTHDHLPGTYTSPSGPVTGNSGPPV